MLPDSACAVKVKTDVAYWLQWLVVTEENCWCSGAQPSAWSVSSSRLQRFVFWWSGGPTGTWLTEELIYIHSNTLHICGQNWQIIDSSQITSILYFEQN